MALTFPEESSFGLKQPGEKKRPYTVVNHTDTQVNSDKTVFVVVVFNTDKNNRGVYKERGGTERRERWIIVRTRQHQHD